MRWGRYSGLLSELVGVVLAGSHSVVNAVTTYFDSTADKVAKS